MSGPLVRVRIVEFEGIGPGPLAGRLRGAQPEAGLRQNDRLGSGRTAGSRGRTRPELRRLDRVAGAIGASWRAADRAADGGFITIGALEPQFYTLLLEELGLADVDPAGQYDTATWPPLKARLTVLSASQTRAHWCAVLEGCDACFAPVLSIAEAVEHPRNAARGIYSTAANGVVLAAAAPRLRPLP